MNNQIRECLIDLGVVTEESIVPYYPVVRDRDDISVFKCTRSGVVFLSRSDHMDIGHYSHTEAATYWGVEDRLEAVNKCKYDDERRFFQFRELVAGRSWIDIGTGAGGILDLLGIYASEVAAVEPQDEIRKQLVDAGYKVTSTLDELEDSSFDVATLFHVFEHLTDPLGALNVLKQKLRANGKIVIEVPHAKDFLLTFLDIEEFKAFTFWSEHLVLHTRESLQVFLQYCGYRNIAIQGFQRYPLSNHLYWLKERKPGGHQKWSVLDRPELTSAYSGMLCEIDRTDTLIAVAEV